MKLFTLIGFSRDYFVSRTLPIEVLNIGRKSNLVFSLIMQSSAKLLQESLIYFLQPWHYSFTHNRSERALLSQPALFSREHEILSSICFDGSIMNRKEDGTTDDRECHNFGFGFPLIFSEGPNLYI